MLNRIMNYHIELLDQIAKYFLLATVFLIPISTTFGELSYLLTVATFITAGNWKVKIKQLVGNPLTYIFWLSAAIVFVGLFYTHAPTSLSLRIASKSLWLLLTPFLIILAKDDEILRKDAINIFLASMIFTLILSYLKYFHIVTIHPLLQDGSVFKDYIVQSFLMIIALLIIIPRIMNKGRFLWSYVFLFLAISFNVAFLSYSRIGYVLLFFLSLYSFLKFYKSKRIYIPVLLVVAALIISICFSPFFMARTKEAFNLIKNYQANSLANNSFSIRADENSLAFQLIKHKPLFGYGTGSLRPLFEKIAPEESQKNSCALLDSGYMNIIFQYGLFGFLLFSGCALFLWKKIRYLPKDERFIMEGILLMMLCGLIFNNWITETTTSHIFSVFVAVF